MSLTVGAGRFFLQPHEILDDLERIRAAIDGIAGLDEDRVAAGPVAIVIDQACGAQDIPPGGKIAMEVADRNDAMQGGGCGRYGQGQDRRQPSKARPKTPQMRPPFWYFLRRRVLSNFRLSCKHCRQRPWGLVTGMLKIMIIRHAEKHQHGSHDRGVSEDGRPAHHELTVRGWQRAGALVHLFAPPGGLPDGSTIQTPRSIFASDATRDSPSLRAMHTAGPLAAALGCRSIMRMRKKKRRRWRR